MAQTLSLFTAAVGGFVGPGAVHPEVGEAARAHLASAVGEALSDACVTDGGDHLALLLSHPHGEEHEPTHRLAWAALRAAADRAEALGQFEPGRDLLTDRFPGSMRVAGPGVAEATLVARPSEPIALFLLDGVAAGGLNLPLLRTFGDPFTTPSLATSEALRPGFAFEVHDPVSLRKAMLTTPEELYDLFALASARERYVLKRVVTRTSGEVCAVATSDGRRQAGGDPGRRAAALVRCEGAFPAVSEALAPFIAAASAAPVARALGFQLTAAGRLVGPRDLLAGGEAASADRPTPFPTDLPETDLPETDWPELEQRLDARWASL